MARFVIVTCILVLSLVASALPARAGVNVTFSTIDFPGADWTEVHGVTRYGPLLLSAEVVGIYHDTHGTHGFLLAGGHYTALDVPGGTETWALGINGLHQIVGSYVANGLRQPFRYSAGTYTKIKLVDCALLRGGGVFDLDANGINNAGLIVGSTGIRDGFVFQNGRCFFVISGYQTDIYQINNAGKAAATVVDVNYATHGETLFPALSNEPQTRFDFPGAISTYAAGINNSDQLVGSYTTGFRRLLRFHGFLYAGGAYSTIDFPGAYGTQLYGVDDPSPTGSYAIVGRYYGFFGSSHGFIASVAQQPVLQLNRDRK